MSKKSNYISTNRSKHYLKCHLIFVCKYRKKLLAGQLKPEPLTSGVINYPNPVSAPNTLFRLFLVSPCPQIL